VAAAGLADVVAADPYPAVVLRGGQHLAEQLAVGLLDEGALGEGVAGFADPGGEGVAHLLQLAEAEEARGARCRNPVRDVHPAESLGDERAQLMLELANLTAQLGTRCQLVYYLESLQHSRHKQILSRLEGRGDNP
jgi:hypothetical protein